jgi:hypothetical protein
MVLEVGVGGWILLDYSDGGVKVGDRYKKAAPFGGAAF